MKIQDLQEHLDKVKVHLKDELSKIRTGRANATILDGIRVAAYAGVDPMALKEVASVSIPDAQSILIEPWDKTLLPKIEESIRSANLGLAPINEGTNIRISIPQLTEDRRKEFAKLVSSTVEQAKISVRVIRQNAIKAIEESEDNGVISEDEMVRQKKIIEDKISQTNKDLDVAGEAKEKELMVV
jgi:ribosome recycling factor